MEAPEQSPSAPKPCRLLLIRTVAPVTRSWTKMFMRGFGPEAKVDALLSNATWRPSAEIEGTSLRPSPCLPFEATLTRVVAFCARADEGDQIGLDATTRTANVT